jgi:hypothetical protein
MFTRCFENRGRSMDRRPARPHHAALQPLSATTGTGQALCGPTWATLPDTAASAEPGPLPMSSRHVARKHSLSGTFTVGTVTPPADARDLLVVASARCRLAAWWACWWVLLDGTDKAGDWRRRKHGHCVGKDVSVRASSCTGPDRPTVPPTYTAPVP